MPLTDHEVDRIAAAVVAKWEAAPPHKCVAFSPEERGDLHQAARTLKVAKNAGIVAMVGGIITGMLAAIWKGASLLSRQQ